MGCVNRSSKEFKALAARNGLAINDLELITHKYWLETGNETLFPSDIYISAQLGNRHYIEHIKEVRKWWEMAYSSPREFISADAVHNAYREAAKYFPESAIVYYENNKGHYVLSVKRPVEKADYTKDDFFEEFDKMGSMKDVKKLKLGIKEKQVYSINAVQRLYNRFNTDKTSQALADRAFNIARELGLQVTFDESLPFGTMGRYTSKENSLRFKKSFLERDMMNDTKAPILLHEVLHALSMYALSNHTKNWKRSEDLESFRTEMNSLYQDLKSNSLLKGERGVVDLYEFVAELANPVFRSKIQQIDKEIKKSFWSRVIDAFKKLLGLHVTNTYYQRSMNALEKALDAFDIDTYMRYNSIKKPLRDGYNAKDWAFNSMSDAEVKSKVADYVEKQLSTQPHKKEFIKSLSGEQLKDELSLIRQESADYNLVNGIEEEHKHSGKAVPQDFTFADGTKVKAPFRPNAQQVDALNAMDRFMKSDETSMTLSGYAGTGKTSLMELIAQKGRMQYRPVVFCASTNKAAAVLKNRVSKAGFDASTLNKVFGIQVEIASNSNSYNTKNLVNKVKDSKDIEIHPGTTVIIDEASMINEENYKILNNVAKEKGLKIIYVGDEAQLAPINENKISKVFRNGDGKVVRLTQVERTDDNAILKEATDIRNGKPMSKESAFNSKGEGVAYISPEHQDAIDEVIEHYVKGLKQDPNYFRILAYSNKAVTAYNEQVRSLLGYNTPIPQKGEPMTGYTNWGYQWKTKTYRFINSEAYRVAGTNATKTIKVPIDSGEVYSLEATPMRLQDSFGKDLIVNYVDVKNNPQNREAAKALGREKKRLWAKAKTVSPHTAASYYAKINKIDEFLFVNDDVIDDEAPVDPRTHKKPTLVNKVIDFGYAMTVHKSQGSTFTHVLMDDVDIVKYTTGKASEGQIETNEVAANMQVSDEDVKKFTEVDLGDYSSAESTSNDTIDERQQLEYVGVSRATDTVTVISNGVKKEGSPLHPEKAIKEDNNRLMNKNQNNESNSTRNAATSSEQQQTSNGGLLADAQTRIKGRDGNLRETQKQGILSKEALDKRNQEDRKSLEEFAKEQGKWVNDVDTKLERKYGKRIGHGSEAWVYRKDKDTVIKSRSLTGYETIQDALRSIELHNKLFPETAMKVVGFGESEGEFTVVMEQPFVEGSFATNEDIATFIKGRFKDTEEDPSVQGNTSYKNNEYLLQDLKPQNVIVKVTNGEKQFYVIDGDFYDNLSVKSTTEEELPFPNREHYEVNLPGYRLKKDLYDNPPVDAAWKISYLTELDAQINSLKTDEENFNILNRMDKILVATSEKEYREDVFGEKTEKDRAINEFDRIATQINNLMEGSKDIEELEFHNLTASEIRHTAELLANQLSDLITQLQKKGVLEKEYPTVKTKRDLTKATRKEIVQTVGIDTLIYRAKCLFDSTYAEYDDIETSLQADLIYDNWDGMMHLAADIFAFNEGFGIRRNYETGRFVTTESTNIDYDNFNDYSNDEDAAREEGEKDEQEHWQVETKTIDVLTSMSALVRQGLHECYVLDKDKNKVLSKWGIPERVNPRKATNSLLRWVRGSTSYEMMIDKLSAKEPQNPWLSQLITRLSDKSGNETDFQSQFYGIFSKPFQLYSIILLEDGKYHSMMANSHPALTEAISSVSAQFKVGTHSLFTEHKVNEKLLGSKDTIGKNAPFNLHKAFFEMGQVENALEKGEDLDKEKTETVSNNVVGVCKVLGFPITEDLISDAINKENIHEWYHALRHLTEDLNGAKRALLRGEIKKYDPFKFYGDYNIRTSLNNFLTPVVEKLEDTAINAFYDSGKMYQSYITPSYMTRLMNKFKLEGKDFDDFIENEYGSSEWFYDTKKYYNRFGDGFRFDWLRRLSKDPDTRKMFDHKVELNFNKHNYMKNMTDAEYTISLIAEYFSVSPSIHDDLAPSWYRIPMQSNKPSSDFIKFYSYRGINGEYKDSIVNGMKEFFNQELSRIQTVRMRNSSEGSSETITNWDENGRKFCFLPALNPYLENTAANKEKRTFLREKDGSISDDNEVFAELLQKKVKGEEKLNEDEETKLGNLAEDVIRQSIEDRVQSILDKWEKNGILEAAQKIQGIYPRELDNTKGLSEETRKQHKALIEEHVRAQVENFLWNDHFASKNILMLTVSDIAFYKDAENLQKRLSQLHSPGIRGRKTATDYEGKPVSDGYYRTVILKDFDNFKSNIIANISEVFDRKIAAAPEHAKASLTALKDSLVRKPGTLGPKDKGGKYWNINVADAQGYSSPSSYRKKAFIFGKWSKEAEEIYQKLLNKDYNYSDLETAFQPLKPFVYTKLTKKVGVGDSPIQTMRVPFQAKNSEYLLIMADAILKDEELSRPNLLRAVYRVMEDSEKLMPTKGIDTVQFESAIKSGLQGAMDIAQFRDKPGGEEAAYTFMMNQIFKREYEKDKDGQEKRVYRNYDTDNFVHETSYDDYSMQQEVPEHFKEHEQSHGSQIRMIIPSDLDLYTTDENGVQVDNYYEWTEPDGTKKKVKADEFRKEYEETIGASIEESLNELEEELCLTKGHTKLERNLALSRILQKEILSSPRYGVDLIQACSIDKKTGEFRIPKGDPIQAKRIEHLINSIIKNRVNKQKIAGGPIVQVSNFGTSKQLHIRFNDKKGNLMPLEEEYVPSEHGNLSYKDYCKKWQGGIAYFEVFMPIYSNDLFRKFGRPDGSIDVEAIEAMDPELLKMVSYRIPTEDKYSCAPMKVVGFMPKEAGDAIMLPYELTEIDDSDFDVDKRYVMRKDIPIKERDYHQYDEALIKKGEELYKEFMGSEPKVDYVRGLVSRLIDNPQKFPRDNAFRKALVKEFYKAAFYTEAPKEGKRYRDNKIVDMTYAVLTNEMTADKILNPGGFDAPKKMGYMVAAYKNPGNNLSWKELQGKTTSELKDLSYTDKDLTFADTQVQFYKQNSAASSLIGVFAVNKVAHATLEGNDIWIDVSEICGGHPFEIAGKVFGGRMKIDEKYDEEGNLIGKTLGSLVSASADAVKDPILNLMNINMTTAGMLNTMLRLKMSFNDAALFLSQDVIERTLNYFNKENLNNYVSLDNIINKWLNTYRKNNNITDESEINLEPLTKEELVEGLTSNSHEAIDYKVLLAFQKIRSLANAMRNPTYATRFNSISSAVGPLIIDTLIMEKKMKDFDSAYTEGKTHFYNGKDRNASAVDINDIFRNHKILGRFSETVDLAKRLFYDMPTGSTGFRNTLAIMSADLSSKLYKDKKLFDQFANFYQSYMLLHSGVIDPADLEYFANDFTKEFIKEYKPKYADNELIKAITMNVSKKSGNPFLSINITGADEQVKENLKSAWIDLHKADPVLSKKLFDYSFFRAGIGFSPKTFMALVPTYVKERIKGKDGKSSYVDTYRNLEDLSHSAGHIIDQFVRNNWDNNKLAPIRGGKGTQYKKDIEHGRLEVYREEDLADVAGLSYIKTREKGGVMNLWRYNNVDELTGKITFDLVEPLGNNGEYLEMSLKEADESLTLTTEAKENNDTSNLKTQSPEESTSEETPSAPISTSEAAKEISEMASLIMKQVPKYSVEEAEAKYEDMKLRPRLYRKFLPNVFKQKGLELNEEEALEEFKKYC